MTWAVIVADPPWPQKAGGPLRGREGFLDTKQSLAMPYPTMTVPQIAAMPIADVAADDAHLFLWTTSRFLPSAYSVLQSWGFRYSTTLVWSKAPIGAGLGGMFGISAEFVLYGRRGQPKANGRIGRSVFTWKRPYDARGKPAHSSKPPEFYDLVAELCDGPRLELFARRERPSWDAWGNQAPGPIDIPGLGKAVGL